MGETDEDREGPGVEEQTAVIGTTELNVEPHIMQLELLCFAMGEMKESRIMKQTRGPGEIDKSDSYD